MGEVVVLVEGRGEDVRWGEAEVRAALASGLEAGEKLKPLSVEIAKRCNLTLELGRPRLPEFPTAGVSLDEYCRAQSAAGLSRRLGQLFRDQA